VQVYVAVYKLYYPKLTISVSIRKEGMEYAINTTDFNNRRIIFAISKGLTS
jgi:hypothetical protein